MRAKQGKFFVASRFSFAALTFGKSLSKSADRMTFSRREATTDAARMRLPRTHA
jgi:hypothetical protein